MSVVIDGSSGAGSIVSTPAGIDCPGSCDALFAVGDEVTFAATAGVGATFIGWSDPGCAGFSDCVVTVDQPVSIVGIFNFAGEHMWDRETTGTRDVAYDGQGNLLVVGVDVGADFSVVKLDSSGAEIWSTVFTSAGYDVAQAVAVDAANDVYVVGDFGADMTVGGVLHTGSGSLIVKLSGSTGLPLWARSMRSSFSVQATDVVIDAGGRVVVTGSFRGQLTYWQTPALGSAGGTDIFLGWLTLQGVPIEMRRIGSSGNDRPMAVATSRDGEAVLAGSVAGTVDFNGPQPGGMFTPANGSGFLAKLGPGAVLSWARSAGAINQGDLAVDGLDAIWIASGETLAKYDAQSGLLFSRVFTNASAFGIGVGPRGNATMIGRFSGGVDFGGGSLVPIGGAFDMFIANFDASGQIRWADSFGSIEDTFQNTDWGGGGAVSNDGNIAAIWSTRGNADFGGGVRAAGSFVAVYGP